MKKVLLSLTSLVLVLFATGCSSDKTSDSGDCSKGNIIMITDIGGVNDKSFNQGTNEGIEKLVKEEKGLCSKAIESSAEADYIPNLNSAGDSKPELIVAAGITFGPSVTEVALANPEQKYLLIDSVVESEDGKQLPNVASAVFAEHEGSYLAGVAAGMKAKEAGKDKVGFVGGLELDIIEKFAAGYEAGVHSVDPNIEVLVTYSGSFTDPALGKMEAQKLYNSGAYIIYHAAGGSGNGVISEAKERYAAAMKADKEEDAVWVIGVDRDQYDLGLVKGYDHSVVLTSMEKKVGVASYDVSKLAIEGKFPGGEVLLFDLKNDGVGIPDENPNLSKEIVAKVDEAKEDIKSGKVTVPTALK